MAEGSSLPPGLWLSGLCFLLQALSIILFAAFVRYGPEGSPNLCPPQPNCSWRNLDQALQPPRSRDVHLQALLGLGLLVAFLGRYGPGSVASSILLGAFALQWSILSQGFLHSFLHGKIYIGVQSLVSADFCTAAVLICSGALPGRVSALQLLLLAPLGVLLCSLNEYLLLSLLAVSDGGGSLTVHTFGAFFGLMVSRMLQQPRAGKRREEQDPGQQPEVFAVLGTVFLWLFWPSFSSASSSSAKAEPWAVLNACLSLAAGTVATFVLCPVLGEGSSLGMLQLQDASLATMALMGTGGQLLPTPFGALAGGFLAALLPPLGFRFLTPFLSSRLKIQDPCGVLSVHGLPGALGALLGALLALLATADAYGGRLELLFPLVAQGSRTGSSQALCQLCALPLTLLTATLGGCLTGAILNIRGLRTPPGAQPQETSSLCEGAEEGGDPRPGGKELSTSTAV